MKVVWFLAICALVVGLGAVNIGLGFLTMLVCLPVAQEVLNKRKTPRIQKDDGSVDRLRKKLGY